MPQILNPYFNLFESNKVNINSSDSSRNLALAVGEAVAGRSYDFTSNPSGSFRAFNLDPQVKLLSAASVSQPLYGANLKVELNGSAGTNMNSVSAINAYSLVSGSGHTVGKNVGMTVLADVGNNLTGTSVNDNFSLEVNGVAARTNTVIANARSVSISCPNHGFIRRGLLIGAEGTTGLAAGVNNISFENLGTSRFAGFVTCANGFSATGVINLLSNTLINANLNVNGATTCVGAFTAQSTASFNSLSMSGNAAIAGTLNVTGAATFTSGITSGSLSTSGSVSIGNNCTVLGNGFFSTLQTSLNTPASSSSAGNAGSIRIDSDFIYVCTATNTWKRAALTTW